MYGYHNEYLKLKDFFWDKKPAKFVKKFVDLNLVNINNINCLDIGAGEGKNAVFMAKNGANVDAVDISSVAIKRLEIFSREENLSSKISFNCANALEIQLKEEYYDVIVCYGLLHALENKGQIQLLIEKLRASLKINGYIIVATFNNILPPPEVQDYLNYECFLNNDEISELFNNWNIILNEEGIIEESHNTTSVLHKHSISRIIAQKI